MKTLALALLFACGGEVSVVEVQPLPAPPPTVQVQTQMQVASGPGLMNAGEKWNGRYLCAQGLTDLDLRIDAVNGSQIDATFVFLHAPSGAAGSYRMRGAIAPDGRLTLAPFPEDPWIARPPNYVAVGMTGIVTGTTYRGRIDNPSCGTFNVHRANEQ
jgi:hypothetical protein